MRLVDMLFGVNGQIINISKLYRFDTYSSLSLAVFTIVTNYIFIPIYGIEGAAAATAISIVLFNIIRFFYVYSKLKIQPFDWNILKITLILLLALLVGETLPDLSNVFLDTIYRSVLISLVMASLIYFFKVSEDINRLIIKYFPFFGINKKK
jgi:O-antigen/teichoic acid export membrane protein